MKIDGSIIKVKHPATARDVLQGHPGHVVLESEQVKLLGQRARPLDPDLALKPKKLYFLVQLPEPPPVPPPESRGPQLTSRRARSGINMSAKDRLESLMLSRRAASDMTFSRLPPTSTATEYGSGQGDSSGPLRIRMRLPKAQVAKLVEESKDPAEAAKRIMELCVAGNQEAAGGKTVLERPAPATEVSGPLREKKEVTLLEN